MSKIYDALRKAEREGMRPKRRKSSKKAHDHAKAGREFSFMGFDEQFTRAVQNLRNSIDSEMKHLESRVLMVTSSVKGEGKTTITAALARVMAMGEAEKILIVDCSVGNPSLHVLFGVENKTGIVEYLGGGAAFKDVVQSVDRGVLDLVTAGNLKKSALAPPLFNSDRMEQFIKEAAEAYDYVFIDTAAVLEAPETAIIGSFVNGSIMIINSGKTRREVIKRALLMVEKLEGKFIGTVLNRKKYHIPEFLYKRI
jgi:capsular exopolysaccharide synthesis family protein